MCGFFFVRLFFVLGFFLCVGGFVCLVGLYCFVWILLLLFFGFSLVGERGNVQWGWQLQPSCAGITEGSWWWLWEKGHTPKYSHSCSFYVLHWYLLGCFDLFQWGYFPTTLSSELFYFWYIKVQFTKKDIFWCKSFWLKVSLSTLLNTCTLALCSLAKYISIYLSTLLLGRDCLIKVKP